MLFASPSPRTTSVTFRANRERYIAACPAELPRADDVDFVVLAGERLGHRRAVVDAGAGEALDAGHVEPAVGDAGGDQQRVAGDLAAVAQRERRGRAIQAQLADLLRREDLHAEAPRLRDAAPREVGAAQAGGKAE